MIEAPRGLAARASRRARRPRSRGRPALRRSLLDGFEPVRAAAAANAPLLADLCARGFRLGVVSNGCGNVDVLCADLGYTPAPSRRSSIRGAWVCKPDPAIFIYAAAKRRRGRRAC
jgi:FMN phosphatase YigB (HAD superfamily)